MVARPNIRAAITVTGRRPLRISHNLRPVVAGVSGLGASSLMQQYESGQLSVNLTSPTVDLSNCDPATIAAYNAGLIPTPVCPAPGAMGNGSGGSNPTPTQIPNWLWIALAVVAVLVIRR